VSATPHAQVDAAVELRLVVPEAESVPLPVTMRYCAADPYAVQASFAGEGVAVEWVFARDLLLDGLRRPCGDGDVRVWPSRSGTGDQVLIALSSPDGHAVLEADGGDLRAFLDRTVALVSPGRESEHLDLDAEIGALLAS
jgi:Streptomyces sporulation and cell division protein, SsgA